MDLEKLHALLRGTGISVSKIIENNKASEVYVKTKFVQSNGFEWDTYVPFIDRRSGLNILSEPELADYLKSLKQYFTKEAMEKWRRTEKSRGLISGPVTSIFFEVLLSFKEEFEHLPINPNSARRIQDIKDAGYTLASVPRPEGKKGYNRILLPIPLHAEMGYETFSPQFKARVIRLLKERNAQDSCVLISLKYNLIEYIEDTYPEINTGYLAFITLGDVGGLKCDYLGLEEETATTGMIITAHSSGHKVMVWTPNGEASQRSFLLSDADAIITDNLTKAKELEESLKERTLFERLADRLLSDPKSIFSLK